MNFLKYKFLKISYNFKRDFSNAFNDLNYDGIISIIKHHGLKKIKKPESH